MKFLVWLVVVNGFMSPSTFIHAIKLMTLTDMLILTDNQTLGPMGLSILAFHSYIYVPLKVYAVIYFKANGSYSHCHSYWLLQLSPVSTVNFAECIFKVQ